MATKKPPRLTWDGLQSTDGRYRIGRMTDGKGDDIGYYLAESPLLIIEQEPILERRVKLSADGRQIGIDADGVERPYPAKPGEEWHDPDSHPGNPAPGPSEWVFEMVEVGQADVIVVDDTPGMCGSVQEAQAQAQAIDDGTIDEFEYDRQGPLRQQRADRADIAAEAEAIVAWDRRAEADADLTAAQLKRRRKAAVDALEKQATTARKMFDRLYKETN